MILAKKHFLNFYLKLVFNTIFLSGGGLVALCVFIYQLNYGAIPDWGYFLPMGSLVAFLMNFKLFTGEFKKVPSITLDSQRITFEYIRHTEEYQLNEIRDVNFTGKHEVGEIIPKRIESMQLVFGNGQSKIIPDKSYENFWELKCFLFNHRNPDFSLKKVGIPPNGPEEIVVYKGRQVFCFEAWFMWILGSAFLITQFIMRVEPTIWQRLFLTGYSMLLFWGFSRFMNYFSIAKSLIRIKNHNFFWVDTSIEITEIKEVVIEYVQRGRIAYTQMIIVYNDFQTKPIPGLTLHKKHWKAMMADLESKGIKVRNEAFPLL